VAGKDWFQEFLSDTESHDTHHHHWSKNKCISTRGLRCHEFWVFVVSSLLLFVFCLTNLTHLYD
jgi:hypothetical protein